MTLGLVCDACDSLSPVNRPACGRCGAPLGMVSAHVEPNAKAQPARKAKAQGAAAATPAKAKKAVAAKPRAVEAPPAAAAITEAAPAADWTLPDEPTAVHAAAPERAEAPTRVAAEPPAATDPGARPCPNCNAPIPSTQRFCGECGYRIDVPAAAGKTQFFSTVQESWRARLVLVKGDAVDGVSYHLAGVEHVAGRSDGSLVFADDRLLSPHHCNFFYRGHQLIVRDEGSANGVFVRIKAPVAIEAGQRFLVGEQLLRVEVPQEPPVTPDHEGTWYYGSPRRPSKMHVVQLVAGGERGMVVRAAGDTLSIGREGNHINFPDDPFISGHHAQLSALDDGRLVLTDVGSKNGTFLQVSGETRLDHGDFVFLGQQLMRVEAS